VRIYLDSRDLIVLAERKSDAEYEEVGKWLSDQGHELVLSLSPILECCVPLTKPNSDAVVMRTLARIEKLPHTYLAEAKIPKDELVSAVTAYSAGNEYQAVDPYVSRFDEVLSPFAPPATRAYLKYGLAETVFDVWRTRPDYLRRTFAIQEFWPTRESWIGHAVTIKDMTGLFRSTCVARWPNSTSRSRLIRSTRYRAGSGLRRLAAQARGGAMSSIIKF
jgi:hypothetical protein